MGRDFGRLWAAFVASTAGTWLGFGAFPLLAIRVLGAGPAAVSLLAAAGPAIGALLALPLGPWVESRRRRPVLIAADLVRVAALLTVPLAYVTGRLSLTQLVVVSVVSATANIAFLSAGAAYLKDLVPSDRLLRANARFEATAWTAIAVGPTLGGAAIGLLGPVVTVAANAAGFLLSATGIAAIRRPERRPAAHRFRITDLTDGWRILRADPVLNRLFTNSVQVSALILATEPLLAVRLLGELRWPAWQFGLAFGLPCLGGLLGARLAARVTDRRRALARAGLIRVLAPVGLAFAGSGPAGFALVVAVECVVITSFGVFNPLLATERLDRLPPEAVGRALITWNATTSAAVALTTALGGVLAATIGTRPALATAGILLLMTACRRRDDTTAYRPP